MWTFPAWPISLNGSVYKFLSSAFHHMPRLLRIYLELRAPIPLDSELGTSNNHIVSRSATSQILSPLSSLHQMGGIGTISDWDCVSSHTHPPLCSVLISCQMPQQAGEGLPKLFLCPLDWTQSFRSLWLGVHTSVHILASMPFSCESAWFLITKPISALCPFGVPWQSVPVWLYSWPEGISSWLRPLLAHGGSLCEEAGVEAASYHFKST